MMCHPNPDSMINTVYAEIDPLNLKFIHRDLDKLEGFVTGLDSLPENTARQRRAFGLLDSIRKQFKTLKGDDR